MNPYNSFSTSISGGRRPLLHHPRDQHFVNRDRPLLPVNTSNANTERFRAASPKEGDVLRPDLEWRWFCLSLLLAAGLMIVALAVWRAEPSKSPEVEPWTDSWSDVRPFIQRICHLHHDMSRAKPHKTLTVYEFLNIPRAAPAHQNQQHEHLVTEALANKLSVGYRTVREQPRGDDNDDDAKEAEGGDEEEALSEEDELVLRAADVLLCKETRELYDEMVMPMMLGHGKKARDIAIRDVCARYGHDV